MNDLLSSHHEDLDRRISTLVARALSGDVQDLAVEWDRFERELVDHLALEERELLPGFAVEHPEAAAAILRNHAALRRDLIALGVRADLHLLRAEAVQEFVAELRAHAAEEDRALYAWARAHTDHRGWSTLAERLRAARHAATDALAELGSHTL